MNPPFEIIFPLHVNMRNAIFVALIPISFAVLLIWKSIGNSQTLGSVLSLSIVVLISLLMSGFIIRDFVLQSSFYIEPAGITVREVGLMLKTTVNKYFWNEVEIIGIDTRNAFPAGKRYALFFQCAAGSKIFVMVDTKEENVVKIKDRINDLKTTSQKTTSQKSQAE